MKTLFKIAVTSFIIGCIIVLYINEAIWSYGRAAEESLQQTYDTALVFGGGMRPDGTMTVIQADRVRTATDAYVDGHISHLIMTGDDGSRRANEVDAMRHAAIEHGVPSDAITIDPSSFRTYESCYRARHVFDVSKAVVVSQRFHLPRIRYLCATMGVDTVGLIADRQTYRRIEKAYIREVLANMKAWWQAQIQRPLPEVPN
jgi:vancomycin permeability regulator SanA